MNPVIVIPTFVSPRRRKDSGSVIATYDHTTPLSNPVSYTHLDVYKRQFPT